MGISSSILEYDDIMIERNPHGSRSCAGAPGKVVKYSITEGNALFGPARFGRLLGDQARAYAIDDPVLRRY